MLSERSQMVPSSAQLTTLVIILGSVFVGLVVLAIVLINQDIRCRKQVEEQLRLLNADLEAQRFAVE